MLRTATSRKWKVVIENCKQSKPLTRRVYPSGLRLPVGEPATAGSFVLVLLGEDKSPLLGRFGGVGLLFLPARKEPFLRQTPDDSSLSKLLPHFLGQGVVQDPGVDVTTWGTKLVKFFEDLGIPLFDSSPLSKFPSTLSLLILISCCMQGERQLGRPISNSS